MLQKLPWEILERIASFLTFGSFLQLRLTSTLMKALAESEKLWRDKIQAAFGTEFVMLFSRYKAYQVYIGLCLIQPYIFKANRGVENSPVNPTIEGDETLERWVGLQTWIRCMEDELDELPEAMECSKAIAISPSSVYHLTNQGRLIYGLLVQPGFSSYEQPKSDESDDLIIKAMSCGPIVSLAMTNDNRIIQWDSRPDEESNQQCLPSLLSLRKQIIRQIEVGTYYCCCLTEDNQVVFWDYRWTNVAADSLGTTKELKVFLPMLDRTIASIAATDEFVIALATNHTVYALEIPKTSEQSSFADEFAPDIMLNNEQDDEGEGERMIEVDVDEETEAARREARRLNLAAQDRRRKEKLLPACRSFSRREVRNRMQWKQLSTLDQDIYTSGAHQDGSNFWHDKRYQHLVEKPLKITHISASDHFFILCDPSAGASTRIGAKKRGVAVIGNIGNLRDLLIIPGLQGEQVTKVARGLRAPEEMCWSALTRGGQVLLWGEYLISS